MDKTPTEIHTDITTEFNKLIELFHKEHPSYFIYGIEIHSGQTFTGEMQYLGLRIDIRVQPYVSQEKS